MSSNADIAEQVGRESARRARLAVPSLASGVLYLLSAIIISSILREAPTVGVLQGLEPALKGAASSAESPRAAEVKFESHHAFGLIAASVLAAIAIVFLLMVLLFLLDATRFRRPQTNRSAHPLILFGGVLFAVLTIGNEVLLSIRRHNFASGHDFSIHAVNAITHNSAYDVLAIVTPLAVIALVVGMIITVTNSVRVGLLPRWMGVLGGVSAVLLLLPAPTLTLIPAFWLVSMGILLMGRWPKGDPPAWSAGQARPWPSPADQRAARPQAAVPEPAMPPVGGSRKRRKRNR
ncbi:MAG TPA: hypothetical protein VIC05_09665 [Solirubrobacteraceae bacterium]|jgi:hypothetical protein